MNMNDNDFIDCAKRCGWFLLQRRSDSTLTVVRFESGVGRHQAERRTGSAFTVADLPEDLRKERTS